MSKTLVTHINPDPDAICSVWLFRRFDKDFAKASVVFVSAGQTFQNQTVDSDPDIVHVDTGFGQFDHHQTSDYTCAAKKVLEFLQNKHEYLKDDKVLNRLIEVILQDDHFLQSLWPEPNTDRYNFMFGDILDGLKHNSTLTDQGLIDFGSTCLDGIYTSLKLKIEAEKEIKEGQIFQSKWGQAIALTSKNDEVLPVAQKMGYILAVRKDPDGMLRIKARPDSEVDLSQVYEKVKEMDPEATWFLHASKKMLLNGSYKNKDHVFSKLTLQQVVEILSE